MQQNHNPPLRIIHGVRTVNMAPHRCLDRVEAVSLTKLLNSGGQGWEPAFKRRDSTSNIFLNETLFFSFNIRITCVSWQSCSIALSMTLLQLCPNNDEALLHLIDVPYCCLVDAFLHVLDPKFCSQLDWGLVSLLARVPVQWSLVFHVAATQ